MLPERIEFDSKYAEEETSSASEIAIVTTPTPIDTAAELGFVNVCFLPRVTNNPDFLSFSGLTPESLITRHAAQPDISIAAGR